MECNWGDGVDGGAGSDGVTRVYKEEEEGGVSIAGQTKKKGKKEPLSQWSDNKNRVKKNGCWKAEMNNKFLKSFDIHVHKYKYI